VLGAEQGRRRWLVGYGISVAALGIANIFGLLLLGAHAVTVALHVRRNPDRDVILGWLSAAAAGVAFASPLLALGFAQRGQIQWLTVNKSTSGISTLLLLPGSIAVTAAMFLAIGIALVLAAAQASPGQPAGGQQRSGAWPRAFAELCLPWLVLPPLALFVGTALHPSSPVYTPRYILMCMPALALLAGAAVVTFGRVGGPVALAVIVAAGIPAQVTARRPYGHYDDIRYLDRIVATHALPGDVVLYPNPNADSFGAAYPSGLGRLRDAGIAGGGVATGTLAGTAARYGLIRSRLAAAARVWVVEINNCTTTPAVDSLSGTPLGSGQVLAGLPLHFVRVWHERHSGDWLVLYAHGAGPQGFACPRRLAVARPLKAGPQLTYALAAWLTAWPSR
jgi:mannosyltransferase